MEGAIDRNRMVAKREAGECLREKCRSLRERQKAVYQFVRREESSTRLRPLHKLEQTLFFILCRCIALFMLCSSPLTWQ